jgi:hypothetical protein
VPEIIQRKNIEIKGIASLHFKNDLEEKAFASWLFVVQQQHGFVDLS